MSIFLDSVYNKIFFYFCTFVAGSGDNYPDDVIGMLFRLVHCDSRGDKPVDDGISKVIRIPQLTENSSQAFTLF